MGRSISSMLFTAAFEIILIGRRQMATGIRSQSGQRLPAVWTYMDDVSTLLQTSACTARPLKRLEESLTWAQMRIKPAKSRRLSIRKGVRTDNICFIVDSEKILLLVYQPVRSLGRLYTAGFLDKHMDCLQWLSAAGQPNQDWPEPFARKIQGLVLSICLVPVSDVAPQGLRHQPCHSPKTGLESQKLHPQMAWSSMMPFHHRSTTLKLPLKSLSLGYRQEKVGIIFKLGLDWSSWLKHQGQRPHRPQGMLLKLSTRLLPAWNTWKSLGFSKAGLALAGVLQYTEDVVQGFKEGKTWWSLKSSRLKKRTTKSKPSASNISFSFVFI